MMRRVLACWCLFVAVPVVADNTSNVSNVSPTAPPTAPPTVPPTASNETNSSNASPTAPPTAPPTSSNVTNDSNASPTAPPTTPPTVSNATNETSPTAPPTTPPTVSNATNETSPTAPPTAPPTSSNLTNANLTAPPTAPPTASNNTNASSTAPPTVASTQPPTSPPTPTPAPTQAQVKLQTKIVLTSATDFDQNAYVASLASLSSVPQSEVEVVAVEFKVKSVYEFPAGTTITEGQAVQAIAAQNNVSSSAVTVRISTGAQRRLVGRRLSSVQVEAEISTSDPQVAQAATQSSTNATALSSALTEITGQTIEAPTITAAPSLSVQVETVVKSFGAGAEAPVVPEASALATEFGNAIGKTVVVEIAVLTEAPTPAPPTSSPTVAPTNAPTASPTPLPPGATFAPTNAPTDSPTAAPTSPTSSPTASPTEPPTASPTSSPTLSPTSSPTAAPTSSPTQSPTSSPTASPTEPPTASPTSSPTESPTASPTFSPTQSPTSSPTAPTESPTASPTLSPTQSPTWSPTASPTESPTASPTFSPTQTPTPQPTALVQVLPRCMGNVAGQNGTFLCDDGDARRALEAAQSNGAWTNGTQNYSPVTWSCYVDGQMCHIRSPDCRGKVSSFAYVCAPLLTSDACEAQSACEWLQPSRQIEWSCQSVVKEIDLGCEDIGDRQACMSKIGCFWGFVVGYRDPCEAGRYLPCRGPEECYAIQSPVQCNSQIACTWHEEAPCECAPTRFGPKCENFVSVWQPRNGACLSGDGFANPTQCDGITYGAAFAESAEVCVGNGYCQSWHRMKRALEVVSAAAIADIVVDSIAALLALSFIFISRLAGEDEDDVPIPFLAGHDVVVIILATCFIADVVLQVIVWVEVSGLGDGMEDLVDSYCFSQGSGYESVVELRDTVKDVRRNSLVMAGIAIIGFMLDIAEKVKQIVKPDRMDLLSYAVAALAFFEIGFGVYDYTSNTLELIEGIEAIESAVLGKSALEKGYVCVQLHAEVVAEPSQIAGPPTGEIVGYCVLGLTILVPMLFVCAFCRRKGMPTITVRRHLSEHSSSPHVGTGI